MEDAPKLEPSIIVIFGITGDLAKRKVLPALYHLCKFNLLPEGTKIIGTSRREIDKQQILDTIEECIKGEGEDSEVQVLEQLSGCLSMLKIDPANGEDYSRLGDYLNELETQESRCLDRLFYLSIPPQVYEEIIENLGNSGLNGSCPHGNAKTRLLVEKPFGFDVESAETLIENTERVFSEEQIFRIDHYLAKETAQNILKFRKHNPVFSSQWDGKHIKHIHVIAKEKIGIENRVGFYENVGALRDLVQSHLLQLLSLTAMKMPAELNSDEVHAAKHEFLSNLIPPSTELGIANQVVRGQYDSYRNEVDNPESSTETFASLVLRSKDPRWEGCTFQLTTGKSLDEKLTIIRVSFGEEDPNVLSFRIQPNEGFDVDLMIERPGFAHQLERVKMNFSYAQDFGGVRDAYERVLVDAIRGDRLLFATKSEVIASWNLLQPILDFWRQGSADLEIYQSGTNGPSTKRLEAAFSGKLEDKY